MAPPIPDVLASPDIAERLRRGDREALDAVVRTYSGFLLDHLTHTFGANGSAAAYFKDALHNTWLKFLESPPALEAGQPILPYLKTMVVNFVKSEIRRETRARKTAGSLVDHGLVDFEDANEGLEHRELYDLIELKRKQMSQDEQDALQALEDGDHDAKPSAILSELCGITGEAAQMRILRAGRKLKRLIEDRDNTK